jgi:uncharacterized membrane protein YjjP (DUF1212 family)
VNAERFVLELGRALHAAGGPAYRVEDAMTACSRNFGLEGNFFVTPTAIFAALGAPGAPANTTLFRVQPGAVDLGRLAEIYRLTDDVLRSATTAEQGLERLRALQATAPPWGWLALLAAQVLASAAAAVFLGGGILEMVAAGVVGLSIGLLANAAEGRALQRVYEPLACCMAALLAQAGAALLPATDASLVAIAGVVLLLPGLQLTTALNELALRHLAAGSARMLGALATLLTMAVGVGLGAQIGRTVFGDGASGSGTARADSLWIQEVALVAFAVSLTVLLRARRADMALMVVAVVVAWLGSWLGRLAFGPELGAFAGAFLVALAANGYAHLARGPAALLRIPGLLFLVPGSLGFRGVRHVLDGDLTQGIDLGTRMLVVGTSLVAGLLLAGAVLPPPRDG